MSTRQVIVVLAAGIFIGSVLTSMAAGPNEPPALLMLHGTEKLSAPPIVLNAKGSRQGLGGGQGEFTDVQLIVLKDLVQQLNTSRRKSFEQTVESLRDLVDQQNRFNSSFFEAVR